MARDLIQIRRGNEVDLPSLAQGELGYTLDTKELFVGGLSGNEIIGKDLSLLPIFIKPSGGDDTTIIQNALIDADNSIAKKLIFTSGEYSYDTSLGSLDIPSNLTLVFEKDAIIKPINGLFFINTTSKNNITLIGGKIEGEGAYVSGEHLIKFNNCTNIIIKEMEIEKSGAIGLKLFNCSDCFININSHNNYFYGAEDEEGVNNLWFYCKFNNNGDTGVETSTTGRGLVIWKGDHIKVDNCEIKNNNEYGYRIYSESGDVKTTNYCILSNSYFENNGTLSNPLDIYLYDQSGINNNQFINLQMKRTIVGNFISNQGTNNLFENIIMQGNLSVLQAGIFNFGAYDCMISNISIKNVTQAIAFSPSQTSYGNIITNVKAENIKKFSEIYGSGGKNTFENCIGIHDSVTAISGENGILQQDNGEMILKNCEMYNFHSQYYTNQLTGVTILGCIGKGGIYANMRANITDFSGWKYGNNDMGDFASNNILRYANINIINKGMKFKSTGNPQSVYSTITFAVGDEAELYTPTAGNYSKYKCITAGTPGTWKGTEQLEV